MLHVQNQRRNVVISNRVSSFWGTVVSIACCPVLSILVWQRRIYQLQRLAATIVFVRPFPTAMLVIHRPEFSYCPVALVGIFNSIDNHTVFISELNLFAFVA
ncbi:hypothetical protein ES703_07468 [subsurface metagenome]